jgi:hypothetical protein
MPELGVADPKIDSRNLSFVVCRLSFIDLEPKRYKSYFIFKILTESKAAALHVTYVYVPCQHTHKHPCNNTWTACTGHAYTFHQHLRTHQSGAISAYRRLAILTKDERSNYSRTRVFLVHNSQGVPKSIRLPGQRHHHHHHHHRHQACTRARRGMWKQQQRDKKKLHPPRIIR